LLVEDAVSRLGSARALSHRVGLSENQISRARCRRGISDQAAGKIIDAVIAMDAPAERSVFATLPEGFFALESTAQVPILERSLKTASWHAAPKMERDTIEALLFSIADAYLDTPTGEQARRLYENLP
jgi:hypothetical protein